MSFDYEKAEEVYDDIHDKAKAFYMEKGKSEKEADKIAHAIATKMMFRIYGPDRARRFLRRKHR